jgi:glycosyltransferase involved in cell wall biosynthesis
MPHNFEKKIILYQGNLNYGRGLEQMILAMKSLDATLWICGNGDLYKNLRYLIDMNHLSEKVILWGYKTPSELQKMTSQATIGINLLENRGLNYYYSLANKYFDYIQHKIPSICMNFPEYKRLNNEIECSVMIENIEMDSIINGINRLFSDKYYYLKLQNNCDIASQKYTWDSQKERLISHYI